jgi:GNAT superfamily N-acetyltransferase
LGYVGWAEGRAVSTAATFARPAAVAVYWVATLPEYQGRGYAEALVRYALAQTGRARTLLQASPAGYPLYERMGYRPVTKFTYYAIPSNA